MTDGRPARLLNRSFAPLTRVLVRVLCPHSSRTPLRLLAPELVTE